MEKVYYVRFNYDGVEPKGLKRSIIENEFVNAYSKYCDYTNPLISKWNDEYDKLDLPNDGVDEDGAINPDSEYNRYMADKFTIYANMITDQNKSYFIKKFKIGIGCDFQAELADGTNMSFYLVEG